MQLQKAFSVCVVAYLMFSSLCFSAGCSFTDRIGDHDNTLVRGDCATRGDTDNPKSGTFIRARNMTNDTVYEFTKNDNGALYNAVLDIWKTGVADLGITSTDYDNIKFAGRYYYEF